MHRKWSSNTRINRTKCVHGQSCLAYRAGSEATGTRISVPGFGQNLDVVLSSHRQAGGHYLYKLAATAAVLLGGLTPTIIITLSVAPQEIKHSFHTSGSIEYIMKYQLHRMDQLFKQL